MPTVSVNRDLLFKMLGRKFTDEEFNELGFQFGIEVDDIVDEAEKGITYKIEVGANRYDLLCIEGIAQALNVFLGNQKVPKFKVVAAKEPEQYKLIISPATSKVRPFAVAAVLRNIKFDQNVYDSFIDLQDKLHQNLARKRTLVAIGTHDLDTITGPFIYDARPPKDISFIPLNQTRAFRADELMEYYSHDSHLREYLPILKDKDVYPVIMDQKGVVLSLPPIINGNHSKISLKTRNVLIECTAVDKYKAQIVLDTLICMFSGYCEKPYTVEPFQVEYYNGEKIQYPFLQYREQEASVLFCNSLIGIQETPESISKMLTSMSLSAEPRGSDKIVVQVPPTRYDILHECDIAEDLGIAYGFDKLSADKHLPSTNTIGQECEINYLTDKMRLLLSQNNYIEACTFSLCSKLDMGEKMRVNLDNESWVRIGNPKTIDCEALRINLLPGILKTAASNKHISLPLRLFEVADVVVQDKNPITSRGTGARNERHLCAINCNVRSGMEILQGLLDNIMIALKVIYTEVKGTKGYYLLEQDHPSFFPGFCGTVIVDSIPVGRIGVVHPEVIANFNLSCPAAALELNLEKIFNITGFGH